MLLIKNSLKTICSGIFISTFCIAVISSLLIFAFAMDKQNAPLELSHRDMKGILGGAVCCDNCQEIDEFYEECYHTQEYPTSPNCNQDLSRCIYNTLVTASCEPNQENAYGCDASADFPVTHSLHQDLYGVNECVWSTSTWEVHRVIYYGCDVGDVKYCDDYTYLKSCNEAGEGCEVGCWFEETDKLLAKMTCAICS